MCFPVGCLEFRKCYSGAGRFTQLEKASLSHFDAIKMRNPQKSLEIDLVPPLPVSRSCVRTLLYKSPSVIWFAPALLLLCFYFVVPLYMNGSTRPTDQIDHDLLAMKYLDLRV